MERIAELVQESARLLLKDHLTVAAAESCTGGLVCASFVSLAGSSDWFSEGCVTYSNEAKMHRLGVKKSTLDRFSAVASETVIEMAEGIRATSGTDIGISTTGYAGPGGAECGLVYIACADKNGSIAKELHLSGDRNEVRRAATEAVIELMISRLCG